MRLLPSLLAGLKAVCAAFPDPRKGRGGNIAMADFGLSAFAMFFMQSVSFLAFQRALEKGQGRSNCQSLFGIEKIPSDNYIRDMLDEADPALLAPCFEHLEALLADPPLRQAFGRLGGRTLVAWDGTEFFCSQKLGCPHCLTRKRSNGKVESYHAMLAATVVAPGHAKIVPLMPEFIAPQDGAEKQDCERNAVKRWFDKHHARLAPLRPISLGDDLFACQPIAAMVKDNGGDFIFTAKESSHTALYDFIKGAKAFRHDEKVRKGKATETFRSTLDRRARGRSQANQLLRSSGHPHRLCGLSLLVRLPRSPRHLHHPARTAENPKNRMRRPTLPTFRIAALER
jgi:hypothetical protein